MEIENQSRITMDLKEIEFFLKEKGRLGYQQELAEVSVSDDKTKLNLVYSSAQNVGIDTLLSYMIDVEEEKSAWLGYPLKKAWPDMSVRLYNTLTAVGVGCFAELTESKFTALIKGREFGRLTFRELEKIVNELEGRLNNRVFYLVKEHKPSIFS